MSDIFTSENLTFLVQGAGVSLLLALGSVAIGCVIGILLAAAKLSHSKVLHVIANVYVELFRGTPMLLQILFFYPGIALHIGLAKAQIDMKIRILSLCSNSYHNCN